MKLPLLLFSLLLGMLLVLAIVVIRGEPGEYHGVAHPVYSDTMQQGGSGAQRHDSIRWLGWAFGSLQIIFFVAAILLGVKQERRRLWLYVLGGTVYVSIFSFLALADQWYVRDQPAALVLAFPLPTALMLYGLWGIPAVFILAYAIKFDSWILTPEDTQRFEKLLRSQQRHGNGH